MNGVNQTNMLLSKVLVEKGIMVSSHGELGYDGEKCYLLNILTGKHN